jgi:hypothetical protein
LRNPHRKHLAEVEVWDATNRVYLWHLMATNEPAAYAVSSGAMMPDAIAYAVVPDGMSQIFPEKGSEPSVPLAGARIVYRFLYLTDHPVYGFTQEVLSRAVRYEGESAEIVKLLPRDEMRPPWKSKAERDTFVATVAHEVRQNTPFFIRVATTGEGTACDRETVEALMEFVGIEDPYLAYQELRGLDAIVIYGGTRDGGVDSRRLTSVKPLASFTNLTTLVLANNRLRDISPLKSLVRLEFLRLDGNLVEDITPIMELPKLRVLDVTGNPNAQRARLDELSDRGVIVRDYDR